MPRNSERYSYEKSKKKIQGRLEMIREALDSISASVAPEESKFQKSGEIYKPQDRVRKIQQIMVDAEIRIDEIVAP
ncbi:MAG: hypothetical protein LBJ46_08160 [Planctomycetota bacterium]|jgi:hypothetical protein|nr:hypothetical protein [Planctomycetota bacterium]